MNELPRSESGDDLQLVPTGNGRKALEADDAAMTTSGILLGQVPTFSELMERMVLLGQLCKGSFLAVWAITAVLLRLGAWRIGRSSLELARTRFA